MGVRILAGKAGERDAAAMFCSTTGWMIGPIFEAPDAADQIHAFLVWLAELRWIDDRVAIFGDEYGRRTYSAGGDPREWNDVGLELLITYWRSEHVGEDGFLLDPQECSCGHRHLAGDEAEDEGCASCECAEWRPGNELARKRAEAGEETLV